MKKIKLTRGYFALIDDEDFDRVNQFKWYLAIKKSKNKKFLPYAVHDFRGKLEMTKKYGARHISLHRFILEITDKNIQVDHKDGDGLNNQKNNLRFCTQTQNNQNFYIGKRNKSGYKGVCYSEKLKKWRANIVINRKQTHLGLFLNKIDAARAYNQAAQEHFGEFARLNQI